MPPRPLHYQKAIGRDFVLYEQVDMHLVTDDVRMFIKPIPRYLFDIDFWRQIFICENNCACQPDNPDTKGTPGTKWRQQRGKYAKSINYISWHSDSCYRTYL